MKKARTSHTIRTMNEYKARVWVPLLGSAFFAIWFVASFWNNRYTWGFDFLRYYPVWLRIVWLISGIALLVLLSRYSERISNRIAPLKSGMSYIILAIFSLICFILLRSRVPLLGDGYFRLLDLQSGNVFSTTAPLTTMVLNALYRLFKLLFEDTQSTKLAYATVSIIAGLGAVSMYYCIGRRWFHKAGWFAVLLLAGLGLNRIFYGYVENYALFTTSLLFYFWFCVRSLNTHEKPLKATLFFALSLSLHFAGFFLIPSLFVLWGYCLFHKKCTAKHIFMFIIVLLAVPACVLAIARIIAGHELFTAILTRAPLSPFLPLTENEHGYAVLSSVHLIDVCNQLLLTVPAVLFVAVAIIISGTRRIRSQLALFLCVAVAGAVSFLLMVDPKLGMRRDWDLFVWTGVPILLFILVLLKEKKENDVVLGAAVLSLWLFLPWIGINASESMSVARYKHMLDDETKTIAYGYRNLALYYAERGNDKMEEWAYCQATQREPENAKAAHKCGLVLLKHDKADSAIVYLKRAVSLDPQRYEYWDNYGVALIHCGRYTEAISALHRALSLDSCSSVAYANLGTIYLNRGQWKKADSVFALAYKHGMDDAWFYLCWGTSQLRSGNHRKAMHTLEQALREGAPRDHVLPLYKEAEAAAQNKISGK